VAGNLVCRSNCIAETCGRESDKVKRMDEREVKMGNENGTEDRVNLVAPKLEVTVA
jgi:hypothetical protein